jgi:hypothetical protein
MYKHFYFIGWVKVPNCFHLLADIHATLFLLAVISNTATRAFFA